MKAWQNLVAEIEQQKETTRISQEELKTKENYLTDKEAKMQQELKRLAVWEKKNAESEKHLIKIAKATDEKVHRITTWAKELATKEEHLNNQSCIKPTASEQEQRIESIDAAVQTCQATETETERNSEAIQTSMLASQNNKACLLESKSCQTETETNDKSIQTNMAIIRTSHKNLAAPSRKINHEKAVQVSGPSKKMSHEKEVQVIIPQSCCLKFKTQMYSIITTEKSNFAETTMTALDNMTVSIKKYGWYC